MSDSKYSNKAKGIMHGLEESEARETKTKDEKNIGVKKEKSNYVKRETKKRSFLLTVDHIEKLYMLKAKNSEKTLSAIVGEAIEEYYERHWE